MKMLDNNHSFSPALAQVLSIQKALLLKEIGGWCEHNYQNSKNIDEDGFSWVFMSVSGKGVKNSPKNCFSKKFPYMAERSIHRWLDQLEEDGWIYTKVDNKLNYDKTKSYRIDVEKYNNAIVSKSLRQNGESVRQNGESNRQNGEPIHSLNNSLNNNYIKENNFLDAIGANKALNEYLEDDKNLKNLGEAILKKFASKEEAKNFYLAVADSFCNKGFSKYKYKVRNIDEILPKFLTWCRNAKNNKTIAPVHRLASQFTKEEFEAAREHLLRETTSPIIKTRIVNMSMANVMNFLEPMLEKTKNSGKFKHAEALYMTDLLKIFLRYEHTRNKLKDIFSDLSHASKFKSVWNFIDRRRDFIN